MDGDPQAAAPRSRPYDPGARGRAALIVVLGVVLLGSLVYLLVLAFSGASFVDLSSPLRFHHPRPWLIAAIVAAVLALAAWAQSERARARLASDAGDARSAREAHAEATARLERLESDHQRLEDDHSQARERLQRAERDRDRTRSELDKVVRAWRSEREFNRELRGQIERMQRAHGLLGRHDDVRQMVLELTMGLVEAEKGILFSRHETSEDRLEMVCFLGFDNDPSDSALGQRFATEVIEHDRTVREDDERRVESERRTAADEEVHNLLAIPIYLADEFSGVIVCANREDGFDGLEDEVLLAIGDHAGAVLQNSRLHGDLRNAYLSTIAVLADAIELKDPELRGHSDAVSDYVLAVADRLEFEPRRREQLIFASLLHDVGKLGISERILLKPAALTPEERSIIQLHPRIGYQLVRQVPALQDISLAVLHHHERFDGGGYPAGLKGEAIPMEARIISVADTFSAITSDRPYDPPRSAEEACRELERCAGEQFDPEVVTLFCEEVRRRPPEEIAAEAPAPEPELELHRGDGEFKLGARSFGITDSLTMLYSHRHMHETARSEAQRAELQNAPFAVIVAELVDLTEHNRTHGFAAGDAALQSVAAAIQRVAGRCRGLGFRASGRRLALIAPDLDEDAADRLTVSLVAEIREELAVGPRVAVGAAAWLPGDDGERVIERAALAARDGLPVAD